MTGCGLAWWVQARPIPRGLANRAYVPAFRGPVRLCACASSQESPSWLANPAIAQREVLRRYYVASSPEEMLEIVSKSTAFLDVHTSLDLLCHTAEARLRGQVQGDLEDLLQALYALVADHVPSFKPVQLGSLLWSTAIVGAPCELADELVEQVAAQELAAGRVCSYNTRELCSIIHACGSLARRRSPNTTAYVTALAAELAGRIESQPYVRSSLGASDFADLAAACAAIFRHDGSAKCGSGGDGSPTTDGLPPATAALLDVLAHEVRHQLANKHSVRCPFTPRELVRLLSSYSVLDHRSAKVSGMLDAVAGFVVRRIKDRHSNAVSRPQDLASLLEAYASLRHNSVAVPELLSAVGEQVCLNAARQQEWELGATSAATQSSSSSGGASGGGSSGSGGGPRPGLPGSVGAVGAASCGTAPGGVGKGGSAYAAAVAPGRPASADLTCPIHTLNHLLASHVELGYAPSGLMLQALAPSICRQLPTTAPPQVLRLLELLVAVGGSPGPAALGLMLARLQDRAAVPSNAQLALEGSGQGAQEAQAEGGGGDMLQLGWALVAELGGGPAASTQHPTA